MRWVAAFAGLVLLGAPAWAGAGPDVSVRAAGPISPQSGLVTVNNLGPGDTEVQVVWNVSGLDPSMVTVSAGTPACPQAQRQRYGTCWFPLPAGAGVDVSFPGFSLTPVAGKSGPAGSLVVSVRSDGGTDPVSANNSVTIPVVVQGPPPTTPPPTTPAPTPTTVPPTTVPPTTVPPTTVPPTTVPPTTPAPTPTTVPPTTVPPTTVPPTTVPPTTVPPTTVPPTSSSAVPVPSPTPPAGSGGGLAVTGSQSALAGGIGLAVLLLGAVLFLVSRRRRVVVVAPEDERA